MYLVLAALVIISLAVSILHKVRGLAVGERRMHPEGFGNEWVEK